MNWQQVLTYGLPIIMGIYLLIIAYYLHLELYALALIGQSLIIRIRNKSETASQNSFPEGKAKQSVAQLFETSLFFNHSLAILTTFASIAIIAELPIDFRYKLGIVPIAATLLPYVWSFTRATNVGINGGIMGVILGLLWLAWREPNITLLHDSFYFLVINFTANLSGWLGGWVGAGQLKEGNTVNLFKILINGQGACLNQLVATVHDCVTSILDPDSGANRKTDLKFLDSKPQMTVAQGVPCCSVLSYRHELTWLKKIRPQKIAKSWLGKGVYHSPNEIIDVMFNVFQNIVTKAIFLRFPENGETQEASTDTSNQPVVIYLIVLQYKETPSIVWVTPDVEELSRKLSEQIAAALSSPSERDGKACASWSLQSQQSVLIQNWQPKITLEQYSKKTIGASLPYQAVSQAQLSDGINLPKPIMDEIATNPSLFDHFRGKVATFLAFLIFEATIALTINVLSSYVYELFRQ